MTGALAYQDQMRLPLCLVEDPGGTDDTVPGADFFERFGFQYIYDRPRYALNTETISAEMLRRAAGGRDGIARSARYDPAGGRAGGAALARTFRQREAVQGLWFFYGEERGVL